MNVRTHGELVLMGSSGFASRLMHWVMVGLAETIRHGVHSAQTVPAPLCLSQSAGAAAGVRR